MGTRCFWDSNTDNQASATFFNVSFLPSLLSFIFLFYFITSK